MNKTLIAATASLMFAGGAFAATGKSPADGAITESTDPAKIAAVERHAEELQARSLHGANTSGTSAKAMSKGSTKHMKHSKKQPHTSAVSKTSSPKP